MCKFRGIIAIRQTSSSTVDKLVLNMCSTLGKLFKIEELRHKKYNDIHFIMFSCTEDVDLYKLYSEELLSNDESFNNLGSDDLQLIVYNDNSRKFSCMHSEINTFISSDAPVLRENFSYTMSDLGRLYFFLQNTRVSASKYIDYANKIDLKYTKDGVGKNYLVAVSMVKSLHLCNLEVDNSIELCELILDSWVYGKAI